MFYTTSLIFSIYLLIVILYALNKQLQSKPVQKIVGKAFSKMPPGLFIRLFLEINFTLTIISYIQLLELREITSWIDVTSSFLGVVGASLCFFVPVISLFIIIKLRKQNLLHEKRIIANYGELYEQQLWNSPTMYQLSYNVFFMVRRLATFFATFFMTKIPSFQIGCMMWMTTLWMGYTIATKPFTDPVLNGLEFINELFYYFILLMCFTFTELLPDL